MLVFFVVKVGGQALFFFDKSGLYVHWFYLENETIHQRVLGTKPLVLNPMFIYVILNTKTNSTSQKLKTTSKVQNLPSITDLKFAP